MQIKNYFVSLSGPSHDRARRRYLTDFRPYVREIDEKLVNEYCVPLFTKLFIINEITDTAKIGYRRCWPIAAKNKTAP